MNGLKPAAFRKSKPDEDRTRSEKKIRPRYTVECPRRAECSPLQGAPEIAGAANSNVKLDFRVDFSGTHRKALQASARLQSGRD